VHLPVAGERTVTVYLLCVTLNYQDPKMPEAPCFEPTTREACITDLNHWLVDARAYLDRNQLKWYPLAVCRPEERT
jgi:hypothetical protein